MSLDDRLRGVQLDSERVDLERALAAVRRKAQRAKIARNAGVVALLLVAIAAAITVPKVLSNREKPRPAITQPPEPKSTAALSCQESEKQGRLVTYTNSGSLWLYDADADSLRRVAAGIVGGSPTNRRELRVPVGRAEFLGNGCVAYLTKDPIGIDLVSLAGGSSQQLIEEKGSIADFDLSPDGSTLVYLQNDFAGASKWRLKMVSVGEGTTASLLREFAAPVGRGAGSEDEFSVSWSPNGQQILVNNTHSTGVDQDGASIFLLDDNGRLTGHGWIGTHARWSPDGKTIYYRGYAGINGQAWHAFDVVSKTTRTLGLRAGTNNLAVSPDGTRVAYDTSYFGDYPREANVSGKPPVTYLYDLRAGRETVLRRDALGPLWLTSVELLVSNAKAPGRSLNSWALTGTATKFTLGRGGTTISLSATLWGADVLIDQ